MAKITHKTIIRKKRIGLRKSTKLKDFDKKSDPYYFNRRLKVLNEEISGMPKNISILDVGCGTGRFLKALNKKGYKNITGIDSTQQMLNQARTQNKSKLILGDLDKYDFGNKRFDLILFMDVLEHVTDPIKSLRKYQNLLTPKGKILITYPNPYLVPFFNLIGLLGLKINYKDNIIFLRKWIAKSDLKLNITQSDAIILLTRVPTWTKKVFERIEQSLPKTVVELFAFCKVLVLEKNSPINSS